LKTINVQRLLLIIIGTVSILEFILWYSGVVDIFKRSLDNALLFFLVLMLTGLTVLLTLNYWSKKEIQ